MFDHSVLESKFFVLNKDVVLISARRKSPFTLHFVVAFSFHFAMQINNFFCENKTFRNFFDDNDFTSQLGRYAFSRSSAKL